MASSSLTLYVNGKEIIITDVDPRCTLLSYLRDTIGLKGTKLGCGEGGCGACTVMISSYDAAQQKIRHFSANACLTPVCALDGHAVTTIEGIGGMKRGMHPVQQRLSSLHGSQCGFCTPGIVMSLYTQLREHPQSSPHEIEECMDGNLCRCTGYRPIIDAARSLSNNKGAGSGCCGGRGGGGCGGCPCADKEGASEGSVLQHSSSEKVIESAESLDEVMASQGLTEPIFPPALVRFRAQPLHIEKKGYSWFQPVTLGALMKLKAAHPQARLIVGNTEVGIETKFKNLEYKVFVNPSHIPELKAISMVEAPGQSSLLQVGAAVTINALRDFANQSTSSGLPGYATRGLLAIRDMLTWFASNQIRNVAAVGGNIVTASPISDLNPMLMASSAVLRVNSSASGARAIPISNFFLAYRVVDLKPDEVLERVDIPLTSEWEFVVPLKQARRREDDISIVTAGLRILLEPTSSGWLVKDFAFAFGGMAPMTVATPLTAAAAIGRRWDAATIESLYDVLRPELSLPESVPGGQAEYRMALAASFLFRSYLKVTEELQKAIDASGQEGLPPAPFVDPSERSGASSFVNQEKPLSRGEQSYLTTSGGLQLARPEPHQPSEEAVRAPVGEPIMHKGAQAQVCGEAVYTDDIPLPAGAAHAALVTSSKAHARILGVDTSIAEASEGFIAYFSAKDVTGSNHIGAVIKDEEVFATEIVKHYGAVIGVIIAETHELAITAAKKVVISYEDLPPIVSISEAIAAGSFFPDTHEILSGDLAGEESTADVIVTGTGKVGGQEHFYLETNCTVVVPVENGHMEVYSSTQNPSKTQNFCAYVCGLPAAQVVCRCKRMGGGFGGKETRSVFIAVTAALAAHLLSRPVSILVERDQDMSITGQRHAFVFNYRAGCDRASGKLKFLDAHLYSNAGFSLDLSQAVMDRALFHCDNAYRWPALRARGTLCRTNQPSHTAFRGFGGPQGMMLTEMVMEHLAQAAGIEVGSFRERNLYKEGDCTHFGQRLEAFNVPTLWQQMIERSQIEEREAAVAAFNAENRWKKRGLSVLPTKFGINFTAKFMNQGGALVHVYTDGTVLISHGGTEMGQGLHTKMIQIAARSFGIPDSSCHIMETATTSVANSSPTAASMSTDLYGMAVLDACEQISARLEPLKQRLPAGTAWKDLINAAFFERIDLSAHGFYAVPTERCGYDWTMQTTDNAQRGHPFNYFTQGVACSEVEIDCLTGDCSLLRVDILMDVGRSINPALDVGQIEGAFVQGFGWCTMEDLIWGDGDHKWVRPGQLFTRGPGTYKIPAFNDVPRDLRVHLFDAENKFCVHSSKAVGEPPFFLGASAFFAIKNAVDAARAGNGVEGYYSLQSPATSERIRMACADNLSQRCCSTSHTEFQPKGSW